MHPKQPDRLTNEQYFEAASPFRIFRQSIQWPIELHWHEFYELTFVLSGEGKHVLNGVSYPLTQGSVFLLTPADFHQLEPQPNDTLEIYNVIFSDEWIADDLYKILFDRPSAYTHQCDDEQFREFKMEFNRIWREAADRQAGSERIVRGALERVLIDLGRIWLLNPPEAVSDSEPQQYEAIRRALVYMQHHFREPLKLEDVARQARLSANYFSECFRRGVGTPFQTYLQDLRLQFAKSLLRVSDLPITDICHASGFGTLPHFERVFKGRTGMTPRSYRKQQTRSSS